jgi:hypothetical protein
VITSHSLFPLKRGVAIVRLNSLAPRSGEREPSGARRVRGFRTQIADDRSELRLPSPGSGFSPSPTSPRFRGAR